MATFPSKSSERYWVKNLNLSLARCHRHVRIVNEITITTTMTTTTTDGLIESWSLCTEHACKQYSWLLIHWLRYGTETFYDRTNITPSPPSVHLVAIDCNSCTTRNINWTQLPCVYWKRGGTLLNSSGGHLLLTICLRQYEQNGPFVDLLRQQLKKGKQWNRIHMVGSIGAIHSRNQSVANDFIDNKQDFFLCIALVLNQLNEYWFEYRTTLI